MQSAGTLAASRANASLALEQAASFLTKCQKENLYSYIYTRSLSIKFQSNDKIRMIHLLDMWLFQVVPRGHHYYKMCLPQYTLVFWNCLCLASFRLFRACQILHGHCEVTGAQHSGKQYIKHKSNTILQCHALMANTLSAQQTFIRGCTALQTGGLDHRTITRCLHL